MTAGSAMTFRAAPLDGLARVVTVLLWAIAAAAVVGGAVAVQRDAFLGGAIMLAVGGGLAAALVWLRRRESRAYVVEGDAVHVEGRSDRRRFEGPISNVRRGALGWRLAGDGGGYGYQGRYRAGGATVRAYVTDRTKVVLLDVGATSLALSPADPDAFVAKVSDGR